MDNWIDLKAEKVPHDILIKRNYEFLYEPVVGEWEPVPDDYGILKILTLLLSENYGFKFRKKVSNNQSIFKKIHSILNNLLSNIIGGGEDQKL